MSENIFQKIIKKEITASVVYEDERVIAFLDIMPVAKGHILLIPKESFVWMQDVPDDLLAYCFLKAKELMSHMKEKLNADLIQVSVVGDEVPHFHIHLIPRFKKDGVKINANKRLKYDSKEEEEEYRKKLEI